MLEQLTESQSRWLAESPVGRMATADAKGAPYVIPVCYVVDGQAIYSVLDAKPKTTSLLRLRRVRNIQTNPQVSLVVDHYEDDWRALGYILLLGRGELLLEGQERVGAIRLLRVKYPQYRDMDVGDNPVIKITPEKVVAWGVVPAWA